MKTIKGTTTFDITVEIEWEVKVPDHVPSQSVVDAMNDATDVDDLEDHVAQYVMADTDDKESTHQDTVVSIHQRIDDIQSAYTNVTEGDDDDEEDN
jgi:hypothetical protein